MTVLYILLFVVLASIYPVKKFIEKRQRLIDLHYRLKDKLLGEYYYESNCERNDGWTKSHYKELYKQRLASLKNIKNKFGIF